MAISFREVTEANFRECIRLKVRDDQPFVASNVYSIAESKISPHWIIRAIYADDKMVGFLMYKLNYREEELYLCRFMIDQEFQHMGYGKGALDLLKEIALADSGIVKIGLSTSPTNAYGIKVYERFGFRDTGVMQCDEEVFVLELQKSQMKQELPNKSLK